jgi:hypothetical protein
MQQLPHTSRDKGDRCTSQHLSTMDSPHYSVHCHTAATKMHILDTSQGAPLLHRRGETGILLPRETTHAFNGHYRSTSEVVCNADDYAHGCRC